MTESASTKRDFALFCAVGLGVYALIRLSNSHKRGPAKPDLKPNLSSLVEYPKGRHSTVDPTKSRPVRTSLIGIASATPITVMEALQTAVSKRGDLPALKHEVKPNVWQTWSWKEYYSDIRIAAKALIHLGLKRFDAVNIIGFNSPQWLIGNMATIAAGGIVGGIYTTNQTAACKYVVDHSRARIVIVENNLQFAKFLPFADECVSCIVVYSEEPKAEYCEQLRRTRVLSWAQFLDIGRQIPLEDELNLRIQQQKPEDACTLIYTSGTTGNPKAVILTHDNLTWTCHPLFSGVGEQDERIVSYLPLSHVAAQIESIHLPIQIAAFRQGNCTVAFARPDAMKGSLTITTKAFEPTFFFGVPRVWEKFQEAIESASGSTTGIKKKIGAWARSCGLWSYRGSQRGRWVRSLFYPLHNMLVYHKVKSALGLGKCRFAASGAAPISQNTVEFFGSLGLPIYNVYGMSENSGPQNISLPHAYVIGACGFPLEGTEVKLDHVEGRDGEGEGEVCFRGRHIMAGYMYDEKETARAIDEDGYMHSGDVGRYDADGYLYITGRIKELLITAGGENIAPVPIEEKLKSLLPAVSNCVVVGDRMKFLSVLITLKTQVDGEGKFTTALIGPALAVSDVKTVEDAIKDPKWTAYIQSGIDQYNKSAVSRAQHIQTFCILLHDFSIPTGELTPTQKLKRTVVTEKYAEAIRSLYPQD